MSSLFGNLPLPSKQASPSPNNSNNNNLNNSNNSLPIISNENNLTSTPLKSSSSTASPKESFITPSSTPLDNTPQDNNNSGKRKSPFPNNSGNRKNLLSKTPEIIGVIGKYVDDKDKSKKGKIENITPKGIGSSTTPSQSPFNTPKQIGDDEEYDISRPNSYEDYKQKQRDDERTVTPSLSSSKSNSVSSVINITAEDDDLLLMPPLPSTQQKSPNIPKTTLTFNIPKKLTPSKSGNEVVEDNKK